MAALEEGALHSASDPAWVKVALGDFDAVLIDHAHCEKKAALTALAMVSMFPDLDELVRRMSKLAQEELRHFYQVHELMRERGLKLGRDPGDPYAQGLLTLVRKGGRAEDRRTDRLLICALIEARSCERLELLAEALTDEKLRHFYGGLAGAEAGHYRLFVDLAARYDDPARVHERLKELAADEARILAALPILPRVH